MSPCVVEGRAVLLDQPVPLSLVQNPEVVDMLPPETTQEPRTHGLGLAFASGARGLGLAFASGAPGLASHAWDVRSGMRTQAALKHDELLTKLGTIHHELQSTAGQVQSSGQDRTMSLGPGPTSEALLSSLTQRVYKLMKKVHDHPFCLWPGRCDSTTEQRISPHL